MIGIVGEEEVAAVGIVGCFEKEEEESRDEYERLNLLLLRSTIDGNLGQASPAADLCRSGGNSCRSRGAVMLKAVRAEKERMREGDAGPDWKRE